MLVSVVDASEFLHELIVSVTKEMYFSTTVDVMEFASGS